MRLCSATDDSSAPDRRSVARQEIAAGARRSNGLRTVRQPARSSTLDPRCIPRAAQVWVHIRVGLNANPPHPARVVAEIRAGPRPYFNDRAGWGGVREE